MNPWTPHLRVDLIIPGENIHIAQSVTLEELMRDRLHPGLERSPDCMDLALSGMRVPTTVAMTLPKYRDALLRNREEIVKEIANRIADSLLQYLDSTDTMRGYKQNGTSRERTTNQRSTKKIE